MQGVTDMLLRLFVLLVLAFGVAIPSIGPAMAAAATASPCAPEVEEAQKKVSDAQIDNSVKTANELIPAAAPSAGLSCMDKIMGDWSRIGSIFSDTGDLDKKLYDHAKAFAIPFLANYLAGQFDIGGFTFSFDFTPIINGALDSLGLGGGGGFGPSFDGCNDLNDFQKGIKDQVTDSVKDSVRQRLKEGQEAGRVEPIQINN